MTANVHIDEGYVAIPKRFSLALALGLMVQAAGFVWYAAKLDARIGNLEEADSRILGRGNDRYGELRGRLDVLEKDRDRLTRVETIMVYIGDALKRIEHKIDIKP